MEHRMTELEGRCQMREERIERIEEGLKGMHRSVDRLFYVLICIVGEIALSGLGVVSG